MRTCYAACGLPPSHYLVLLPHFSPFPRLIHLNPSPSFLCVVAEDVVASIPARTAGFVAGDLKDLVREVCVTAAAKCGGVFGPISVDTDDIAVALLTALPRSGLSSQVCACVCFFVSFGLCLHVCWAAV